MALTKVTGGVVSPSSDYAINNVTGVAATFTGNVSIGGTLTYQDVSNIDAVGIITAQKGIQITGDGLNVTAGIATFAGDVSIADKIIHTGDTNTAIRFPADDTISFETAGSARAFINNAGDLTIGGSAGTLGKLYIKQAADTDTEGLTLLNSGSTNSFRLFLGDTSGTIAHIGHGGQKQINITQTGKVGIGVTNPDHDFHVYQNAGDSVLTLESQGNGNHSAIEFKRTSSGGDGKGAGSIYVTGDTSASEARMHFGVGHNISHGQLPRMTIMGNGEVGIGTDNPSSGTLQVQDGGIAVRGASTPNINFAPGNGGNGNADISFDATDLKIISNSSAANIRIAAYSKLDHIVVKPNGNIGIRTDNPENSDSMQIFGATTPMLTIKAGATGSDTNRRATLNLWTNGNKIYKLQADASDGGLKILDSSTERFVVTSAGVIQCKGETDVLNSILRVTDGTPRIIMSVPSGGLDTRLFNDGSGNFIIGHGVNSDTPTERLRINSAGTLRIKRAVSSSMGNDSIFLALGDTENGTNVNRMIGFGYNSNFGTSVYPASIGYTESDNSGNTRGHLIFATRNTTGATDVPIERLRIQTSGKTSFSYDATPANAQYGQIEISKSGASNADPDWSYVSFHRVGQIAWQQGIDSNDFVIAKTGGSAKDTLDTERLRISSTGQIHLNGASSSTTGTSATDLLMANSAAIRFRKGDDSAWINTIGLDNSNNLKLGWGGSVDEIHFGISGIGEQMRITSTGDMGLGCTDPGADPAIGNDATVFEIRQTTSGNITSGNNRKGAVLRLKHEAQWENGYQDSATDDLGRIEFVTGDSSLGEGVKSVIRCRNLQYYNNQALTFEVATANSTSLLERVRIDSSGRLRVGNTTASADSAFDNLIVGNHSGNVGISILGVNGQQSALGFAKSGALADGYVAYNHNSTATDSSMVIKSSGKIQFNAGSSQKVTITDGGDLGIGQNTPTYKLDLYKGNMRLLAEGSYSENGVSYPSIFLNANYTAANNPGHAKISVYTSSQNTYSGSLIFSPQGYYGGSYTYKDVMRIDADKCVRIGDSIGTPAGSRLSVIHEDGGNGHNDCLAYFETNANDWVMKTYYNSSGTHYHMLFSEQGSTRGTIMGSDGSNVAFTPGSDYRMKENVVDLTGTEGINYCKNLKPRKYNWIDNRKNTGKINTVNGFIAHEVEEAGIGHLVYGNGKDAVNEDGSIDPQTLDYAGMTPILAAAIKGLIDKVETLEAKVAALEGS